MARSLSLTAVLVLPVTLARRRLPVPSSPRSMLPTQRLRSSWKKIDPSPCPRRFAINFPFLCLVRSSRRAPRYGYRCLLGRVSSLLGSPRRSDRVRRYPSLDVDPFPSPPRAHHRSGRREVRVVVDDLAGPLTADAEHGTHLGQPDQRLRHGPRYTYLWRNGRVLRRRAVPRSGPTGTSVGPPRRAVEHVAGVPASVELRYITAQAVDVSLDGGDRHPRAPPDVNHLEFASGDELVGLAPSEAESPRHLCDRKQQDDVLARSMPGPSVRGIPIERWV